MYLKGIEIKGFKSFFEKTNITFPRGMISVVGPNGSGKSNILDAIRWVLGEQSIKSLRGEKLEDVIFSGTQTRNPLGLCEVTLIIDNEDASIDIEYTELSIKRKVYRSGESQFFINGKKCRLKDIRELLLDTGIGKEGYSIISQGKVDEIINSNTNQRRALLEEASGITKYRYKKEEGEKSLDIATQNLERIIDIYSEIENQIRPLKIQKEKAEKYLEYTQELRLQEINKILISNEENKKEMEEIITKKSQLENTIDINSRQLEENISIITKLTDEKEYIVRKKEELYNEKNETNKEIAENKSQISLKKENINSLKTNNEILNEQLIQNTSEIENIKDKLEQLQIDKEQTIKKEILIKDEVIMLEQEQNTSKDELQSISENMRKDEQKSRDIQNEISKMETRMGFLRDNIDAFNQKFKEYEEQEKEYDRNIDSMIEQIKSHDEVILQKMQETQNAEQEIRLNNEEYEKYQQKNSLVFGQIQDNNLTLKDLSAKTNMLEHLENDMQGFSKGVKAILKNDNLTGIQNIVANVIKVKKGYEKAIEQLLSARLENIIISNAKDVKKAIDYLKTEKLGRVTFLPIDTIKASYMQYADEGIKAIDVVEYDEKYKNIISNLLGKMVIVEDIDTALKISSKYNNSFRIATKSGEIFNVGGAITGGSSNSIREVFTRRNSILENKAKIKEIEKTNLYLQQQMQDISDEQSKIKANIQDITANIQILKSNTTEIETKKTVLISQSETIRQMKKQLIEERSSVKESNDQAIQAYEQDKSKLDTYNEDFGLVEQRINQNTRLVEEKNKNLEELGDKLSKLNLQKGLINQEIDTIQTQISSMSETVSQNDQKTQISKNKISTNYLQIQKLQDVISNLEDTNISLGNNLKQISEKLSEIGTGTQKILDELKQKTCEKENISIAQNELNLQKMKLESEESKVSYKIQMLEENLLENYDITLEEALGYKDENVKVSPSVIKRLKQDISALGNVNLDSIDEYAKIEERYILYKTQKEDLEASITKIKSVIRELEKNMIHDFKENFDIINKNFDTIFKILFGGGSSKLILEDETDVLNSNIDISVQPPGKKLRGISMLSGGEKALSAIALLFAIIAKKPVPFCILDEIDAPLDDANIYRYITYLKTLKDLTQFITITHRRGTMEASDYIYGVTMQEKGVSNIVSLKLEDAQHYVEE